MKAIIPIRAYVSQDRRRALSQHRILGMVGMGGVGLGANLGGVNLLFNLFEETHASYSGPRVIDFVVASCVTNQITGFMLVAGGSKTRSILPITRSFSKSHR